MSDSKTFTLKSTNGLFSSLKTPCHVYPPFDPTANLPAPESIELEALWDTGAELCAISENVVKRLRLQPIDETQYFHADGSSMAKIYLINLMLPNTFGIPFVKACGAKLNGFDVIIGMDVITRGDFAVTNVGGVSTFSFRMPSIREIDFLKEKK